MNDVETLQAALSRLTELRENSTPSPWSVYALDWRMIVAGQPIDDDAEILFDVRVREDGDLLAVLHRTIDAQMAILEAALAGHQGRTYEDFEPIGSFATTAFDLARAINGDHS